MDLAAQTDKINKQAVRIKSAAKGFAQAAGKGFHLEPEAAATLIKACEDAIHQLTELMRDVQTLDQAPQLGKTPGAVVVSAFTRNVAMDEHGIAPVIEDLRKTLLDMVSAYRKASTNYAETEAILSQSFKTK